MNRLTVEKKKVEWFYRDGSGKSDLYFLNSKTKDGKHLLFIDWDDDVPKMTLQTMRALQVPGIIVRTPRGHHFISSLPPMEVRVTSILQRMFKADTDWMKHNHERGFSCLRVSTKYEGEKPLWVLGWYFEDKELKKEYEGLIKTYFHKGQPYFIQGDYAF